MQRIAENAENYIINRKDKNIMLKHNENNGKPVVEK